MGKSDKFIFKLWNENQLAPIDIGKPDKFTFKLWNANQ